MQNNKYISDTGLKKTNQYSRNIVEMNTAIARCQVAACEVLSTARDVLTKVHLQECFTANNSKTKPDIRHDF